MRVRAPDLDPTPHVEHSARRVQVSARPPLVGATTRTRAVGRVDPQQLDGPNTVTADWDCCQVAGRPLRELADWRAVLVAGRLADVSGAFTLAWREPDGALTLARDAIGERTLFYAPLREGLVFGSSLRAVLSTGRVPRTLNLSAVAAYLTYAYIPGRETLVQGVYELLPGETVRFHRGQLASRRFWNLPEEPDCPATEQTLSEELRARLEDAVRQRLPEGDAVGAFLSGGLDSSLVVALLRRLHGGPVYTYSLHFGDEYANELPFSSLVARHCGTTHHIVELTPPAVLHHLDETIGLLSDPIGDPLTVPNALLFREAAQQVGVVFNGEGGDPCFGGPKNLPMLLAELYDGGQDARRERSYLRAHLKCFDDLPRMLTPAMRDALAESPLERQLADYFADPRWRQFVSKLQALNIMLKGGHHILPKVDALSAPFGVVPRSPLFDQRVVELSMAVPPQLKLRGSVEKYLLKRSVEDLLPRAILDRPKSGMLVPVEAWFQGPLLPHARARLLDGLTSYDLFDRVWLERLLSGQLGGARPRHGAKIWLLVTLEAWLRTVFQSRDRQGAVGVGLPAP